MPNPGSNGDLWSGLDPVPFALEVMLTVQDQKFHTGGVFKKTSKQEQQARAMMPVSVPEPHTHCPADG